MRIGFSIALIVSLVLMGAGLGAAQTGGTAVNVCGTMTEYRAATQTVPGSITVAGEQFAISTDAESNVHADAKVGSDVCLSGTWVMSQTVGRNLTELTVTPRVAGATAAPRELPSTAAGPATTRSTIDGMTAGIAALMLGALIVALILARRLWSRA